MSSDSHSATLESSPRLQKVYDLLKDGKPHTTMEIIKECNVCAVSTIIHELRENGKIIICLPRKRGVYEYQMEIEPLTSIVKGWSGQGILL